VPDWEKRLTEGGKKPIFEPRLFPDRVILQVQKRLRLKQLTNCLLSAIALSLAFPACKKNSPEAANLVSTVFTGHATFGPAGDPAIGKDISIQWALPGSGCMGVCATEDIAYGRTAADGSFRIPATFDANRFSERNIQVHIFFESSLLCAEDPSGAITFQRYDPAAYGDLQFHLYAATLLTLRSRPLGGHGQGAFSLYYGFGNTAYSMALYEGFPTAGTQMDTVKTVAAPVGIPTYLNWMATYTSGLQAGHLDSIRCTAGGPNEYIVRW
jgi:hypothetical protein